MILKCPSCDAKYQIADGAIGASGRNVRCAACGHYWFQKPDGVEEISILEKENSIKVKKESPNSDAKRKIGFAFKNSGESAKAPHQKMRARAHNKIKMSQITAIAAGWFSAFFILFSLGLLMVQNRTMIAKKWPNSASFFAFLGAPVNLYGLEIKNVSLSMGQDTQGPRLLVKASIANISPNAKTVPYLRVTLLDGNKKVISWLVDPKVTVLEKGAKAEFEGIKRNPPGGNLRAEISFSEMPKDVDSHSISAQHIVSEGDLLLKPAENHSLESATDAHGATPTHGEAAPAAVKDEHAAADLHAETKDHEAAKDSHVTAVGR